MKLERLHEYVLSVVVITIGIGLALYLGQKTGQGEMKPIFLVIGTGVAVTICLVWRTNTWVLIPVFWTLTGQFVALQIPFNAREIVVMMVFVMFLIFKAMKLVRMKPQFELLDGLLFANLFYLATVFARNPVGMDAFGSDRVGGRPYFAVAVGMMAYAVLTRVTMTPGQARRMPLYMIAGDVFFAFIGFITYHFPATVPVLGRFYTGIEVGTYNALQDVHHAEYTGTGREEYFSSLGGDIIRGQCSYYRPPTLLNPLYFFRFALFWLGVYMLMKAGYRSKVFEAMLVFFFATYIRKWAVDVVKIALLGVPLLVFLVGLQGVAFDLPLSAQRALSFLPGNWSPDALEEATGSTEWRVQMWKDALTTDTYIQNKILGDGFGLSRAQYDQTLSDTEDGQENAMIAGAFHSGPVTTIHIVGVVGLVLFYVLMIYMMIYAWRLIRACEGTPFYAIAMFVGILLIIQPFYYTFIFGGFDNAAPEAFFSVGMLKLTKHSLAVYKAAAAPEKVLPVAAVIPMARRPRPLSPGLALR